MTRLNKNTSHRFLSLPTDRHTIEALTDKLLNLFLSSKKNQRFYYAQAEFFIRRINVYDPLPIFVLRPEDIPEGLAKHLLSLGEEMCDKIITNVVRRIYESIDPYYFHTSGIYGKMKWFLTEDTTE